MKRFIPTSFFLALLFVSVSVRASESLFTSVANTASVAVAAKPAAKNQARNAMKSMLNHVTKPLKKVKQSNATSSTAALAANSSAKPSSPPSQAASSAAAMSPQPKLVRATSSTQLAKGAAALAAWQNKPNARPASIRHSLTLPSRSSNSSKTDLPASSSRAEISSSGSYSPPTLTDRSSENDRSSSSAAIAASATQRALPTQGPLSTQRFEPIHAADGAIKRDSRGRIRGWLPTKTGESKTDAIMIAVSLHESGYCMYMTDNEGVDLPFGLVYSKNVGYVHSVKDLKECTKRGLWFHPDAGLDTEGNFFGEYSFRAQLRKKIHNKEALNQFESIISLFIESALYVHDYKGPLHFAIDDKDVAFYVNECRNGSYNDLTEAQKLYYLRKYTPEQAHILHHWLSDKMQNTRFNNREQAELIKQYMVEIILDKIIRIHYTNIFKKMLSRFLDKLRHEDFDDMYYRFSRKEIEERTSFARTLEKIDQLDVMLNAEIHEVPTRSFFKLPELKEELRSDVDLWIDNFTKPKK